MNDSKTNGIDHDEMQNQGQGVACGGMGQSRPVNSDLVLQLMQLTQRAKTGEIVNAVIVYTRGPGNMDLSFPNGPISSDIYMGLQAASRRLELAVFPWLIDEALNAAAHRRAMAAAGAQGITPGGLIVPGR